MLFGVQNGVTPESPWISVWGRLPCAVWIRNNLDEASVVLADVQSYKFRPGEILAGRIRDVQGEFRR